MENKIAKSEIDKISVSLKNDLAKLSAEAKNIMSDIQAVDDAKQLEIVRNSLKNE